MRIKIGKAGMGGTAQSVEIKPRLRLREDTVLTHFPLFCPKCKKESLIDAKEYVVKAIK